jgi:hypothetical protein
MDCSKQSPAVPTTISKLEVVPVDNMYIWGKVYPKGKISLVEILV